ncbi:asparagine synthase [Azorhizobium caulinodans ORS 571]|uniref:asparagine synthase (glutamine-hydrolyzing) n=1 Tax=Azorhizobium caulinodans (strain ATCC 43989 / DSM 5975 / JCM 20966 / LMG 6465 / NBRC 14845 / NCIMB 13405 / ORS 571) TaxID=438753 RepID=A8I1E3_AZOC5|nr:N-acetylglutaminylglutamine amidotransferase [Azorhizobium caulinodans]BAF87363.1 asparagine synthase [Azorhizobium caulinodans ORS 571]
MCGICGEVNRNGSVRMAPLEAMSDALSPRGPDGFGLLAQGDVALAHRRLSILDLKATSQQPMVDSQLGLAIAFNGCIYNFRDLRQDLKAKGYTFFSEGDTEVILKAYHAWGADCVLRLKGMFAFAIWEMWTGRVVLARDRLGIKPLYLADVGSSLRFASTLPALLAGGGVDTAIDPVGLHHYMSFHSVVPAPRTILRGVRKLPPATLLTLEPDCQRSERQYWSVRMGGDTDTDDMGEEEWRETLIHCLLRAVERRTVSDVPVGVLLSGGLDSSLLVALLAQLGHEDIRTFSVGFEAVGGLKGDEFEYSDLMARAYGTDHTKIVISPERVLSALPGVIGAMSEPMMSHDCVGFYLLAEEVSRHVKVVQSGQGADETFAGYHWHEKMLTAADPLDDYARLYFDRDHAEMAHALSPDMISGDHSRIFVKDFFDRCGETSPINKTLQIDTEIMLVDDPVKRVDNMTMAFGLETRVPFLDHEMVELATRIPSELKVKSGGKHILKEAARRILPPEVVDRPKGYFPVPALKYIRGPYLDFARDVLNQQAARDRGIFRQDYVEGLLGDPEGSLTPKGHSKLWQVTVLEHWLQTHGV